MSKICKVQYNLRLDSKCTEQFLLFTGHWEIMEGFMWNIKACLLNAIVAIVSGSRKCLASGSMKKYKDT